jgi:lysyl endopeptidase
MKRFNPKTRQILLIFSFVIALIESSGQVVTRHNDAVIGHNGIFNQNYPSRPPYIIPAKNIQALLQADAARVGGPLYIADPTPVEINVVQLMSWTEDEQFVYGKFKLIATSAKSISVNLDKFVLPEGSDLYFYNASGKMITGPITAAENTDEQKLGSWFYPGSVLTIEVRCPVELKSQLQLRVSNVAYGYKEVSNFDESSACNDNAICVGNGWVNERNSVALILNGNGTALCSGALINNTCHADIPYILTANHCFNQNSSVGGWRFTFQAFSPTCTPSQNATGVTFLSGSTLRARSAATDFCLVEMNTTPASNSGLIYAGWSRTTNGITETRIIHHPKGDVMKISHDNAPPTTRYF